MDFTLEVILRVHRKFDLVIAAPRAGTLVVGMLVAALRRLAVGGTALDPEMVAALLRRRCATGPDLDALSRNDACSA